ncbi:PilZ domain-containing protein [Methylobacterium sp. V23]|uniref:PilZ domain-containing protein n=1 Tax=Methylobacterium sp. V23 TaxID=2044878 RepID=UPI001FE0700C|nr:PilZ domain-containing protein [Methylobacterium sp. V23]
MALPMEERRSEPRSRTLLAGKIALHGGGVIDCTLRNRSPSGARLRVASVVGIPDRFTLLLEMQGERRPARVAWRKQGEIGIQFVDESAP